ncbi:MAG: TraB/GumN family protein [Leptospirales bacterium]
MKKICTVIILFAGLQTALFSEASVWKVTSKKGNIVYLGGTIHLLFKDNNSIPKEYDWVYENSETLILEVDMSKISPPKMIEYITKNGVYKDGKTLETELSPEVYAKLKAYCEENSLQISVLKIMKPWMVINYLMALKWQKAGITDGVDKYYFNKAVEDGRKVIGLETIQYQLKLLVSLGEGYENEYVVDALGDMDQAENHLHKIVDVWRSGQEQELYELFIKNWKVNFPTMYNNLLVKRNKRWIPKIAGFLRTPETELVLVGVGHFSGPDSVLEMLKEKGYTVEKLIIETAPESNPEDALEENADEKPENKPEKNSTNILFRKDFRNAWSVGPGTENPAQYIFRIALRSFDVRYGFLQYSRGEQNYTSMTSG